MRSEKERLKELKEKHEKMEKNYRKLNFKAKAFREKVLILTKELRKSAVEFYK